MHELCALTINKKKYVSLFFIFSFFEHVSQFPSKKGEQGRRKQPSDGSKLSTIPRITGTQASRGVWRHAPRKFLKIRCPSMLFLAHFHYCMKDILYITLEVQAAQNVSIQNDLTWKTKKNFLQLVVRPKPDKPDRFCRPWRSISVISAVFMLSTMCTTNCYQCVV